MKNKTLTILITGCLLVILGACGHSQERAGTQEIAQQNLASLKKVDTSLEKFETLEDEMMDALAKDLKSSRSESLISKQKGAVGKNFKARQKELTIVQDEMLNIQKTIQTLEDYQQKNAVDLPKEDVTQAIATLTQLNKTYEAFAHYATEAKESEENFYKKYKADLSQEDIATYLSKINLAHGALFQQLEVLTADLSSGNASMNALDKAVE